MQCAYAPLAPIAVNNALTVAASIIRQDQSIRRPQTLPENTKKQGALGRGADKIVPPPGLQITLSEPRIPGASKATSLPLPFVNPSPVFCLRSCTPLLPCSQGKRTAARSSKQFPRHTMQLGNQARTQSPDAKRTKETGGRETQSDLRCMDGQSCTKWPDTAHTC